MQKSQIPLFSSLDTFTQDYLDNIEIILSDYFYKTKGSQSHNQIILVLTNDYLCICQGIKSKEFDTRNLKIVELCYIDFQLKFQVLRQSQIYQKQNTALGNPYAIRFIKEGYQSLTFYNTVEVVTRWKTELETRINVKGFHNLFKPIKKIGKGNFASVYLVERLEDKKMVAIKAFSKESTFAQQKGRQALINEINLMRKMNQSNVMKLHGVYQSQNSIYMALQLLEGNQLFNKIQSKYKFSLVQTKQIMKGLLKGLQHMHSKKIMHRDLKPQNIMLRYSDSCEVVIVDFGLATWAEQQNYLFVRCGTPGYVAPQIINIRDLKTKSDPICDIFSVGLIFHILLLGKSIFPGRTYNQVLNQNRSCNFDLDSYDYQILTSSCHDLLKRMLDKSPQTRITATQALNHPFFNQIRTDNFNDKINIINSPILRVNENMIENRYPLKNKVSICDDSQLKSITLRYPNNTGTNKQNLYMMKKQYSSRISNRI